MTCATPHVGRKCDLVYRVLASIAPKPTVRYATIVNYIKGQINIDVLMLNTDTELMLIGGICGRCYFVPDASGYLVRDQVGRVFLGVQTSCEIDVVCG